MRFCFRFCLLTRGGETQWSWWALHLGKVKWRLNGDVRAAIHIRIIYINTVIITRLQTMHLRLYKYNTLVWLLAFCFAKYPMTFWDALSLWLCLVIAGWDLGTCFRWRSCLVHQERAPCTRGCNTAHCKKHIGVHVSLNPSSSTLKRDPSF